MPPRRRRSDSAPLRGPALDLHERARRRHHERTEDGHRKPARSANRSAPRAPPCAGCRPAAHAGAVRYATRQPAAPPRHPGAPARPSPRPPTSGQGLRRRAALATELTARHARGRGGVMQRLRSVGHAGRLTLVEHLDELRSRLIACLVVLGIAFGFCCWQNHVILQVVNRPLEHPSRTPPTATATPQRGRALHVEVGALLDRLTPALRATQRSEAVLAHDDVSSATRRAAAQAARELGDVVPAIQRAAARGAQRDQARADHARRGRAAHHHVHRRVLRRGPARLPFILCQAYRVHPAGVQPARAARRVALPLLLIVPFLFVAGVTFGVLRCPAPRRRLPADVQQPVVRHPRARAGLLPVRGHGPRPARRALPDPRRRARAHPSRDRQPTAAGREPRLRDR